MKLAVILGFDGRVIAVSSMGMAIKTMSLFPDAKEMQEFKVDEFGDKLLEDEKYWMVEVTRHLDGEMSAEAWFQTRPQKDEMRQKQFSEATVWTVWAKSAFQAETRAIELEREREEED